ncbi:MAG: hypothetical protein AAF267_06825 [Deinococcota bacterium]
MANYRTPFASGLAVRATSTYWLLFMLVACGRGPAPSLDVPSSNVPSSNAPSALLSVAELGSGVLGTRVDVQSLVNGLELSRVDRQVIDRNGIRIQQVTFKIANISQVDIDNLSIYGIQTPISVVGTNVSALRDSLAAPITNADMARSILMVHGRFADGSIDPDKADMQAYTPADQARVQALLDSAFADIDYVVLNRGFVASNESGQANRAIAANETGVVTVATQYPYDPANPAGYPDKFNLQVAFVNEATPRITQGLDESTDDFATRIEQTFNPLPDNLEVVVNEGSSPSVTSTPTTPVTVARPNPPVQAAPVDATSFQLSMQSSGIQTTDVEIETVISGTLQGATVTVG